MAVPVLTVVAPPAAVPLATLPILGVATTFGVATFGVSRFGGTYTVLSGDPLVAYTKVAPVPLA